MNKEVLINKLIDLIEPIVLDKGYEFYHLEFVKESGENYLRVYIDSEEGISLKACEEVSRAVSDMLDVEDPIEDAYYLEVSSPGMERILHNDKHLEKSKGLDVVIKLANLINGKKQVEGKLIDFDKDNIILDIDNKDEAIPRDKIKVVNLKGDF